MAKQDKNADKKEKYDTNDIYVIEDKKKKDDFDLGLDKPDSSYEDDDELDMDDMVDFDDGGD